MFGFRNRSPAGAEIGASRKAALKALRKGRIEKGLLALQPLIEAQARDAAAATALIEVLSERFLPVAEGLDLLMAIFEAHEANDDIVAALGSAMEAGRDIDDLNAPPPDHPLFGRIAQRLSEIVLARRNSGNELSAIDGLSTVTRLMARQQDVLAERCFARLTELRPEESWTFYGQGLYLKTRGRFAEGLAANKRAIELSAWRNDAQEWNLGICATGAGDGEAALRIWRKHRQRLEIGRFDLPEGPYAPCQVRLAERPLAERDAEHDDPGLEENIWIERLSPCHGIIRSVLYDDLGVDYGDVVLFDGAPISVRNHGGHQIPLYPHLATLRRCNYQFYDFVGTQAKAMALSDTSEHLERDAIIYSHTESTVLVCGACWRDETRDHAHSETTEELVVSGRIAAPPDIAPADLLRQLDDALRDEPQNRIFSPDLCLAAGLEERAQIEARRFGMLWAE